MSTRGERADDTRIAISLLVKATGLHVTTHSPGDGVTRRRVFSTAEDYHSSGSLYTALSPRELLTWLRGYHSGLLAGRKGGK